MVILKFILCYKENTFCFKEEKAYAEYIDTDFYLTRVLLRFISYFICAQYYLYKHIVKTRAINKAKKEREIKLKAIRERIDKENEER